MKKQKINISFTQYTDANLLNKAEGIYLSMQGNPDFTTPIPSMADVQAALTAYSTALNAATDRSRDNVADKNTCRSALESILFQLGMYVMNTANGNVNMLIKSGYTLSKTPEHVYISTPDYVTLSNGLSSGELVATVKAVHGAKTYLHQIAPDPVANENDWQTIATSKCQYTFTGLIPGKKYQVRAVAIGSANQIAYGPVSSRFVQ